MPFILLLSSILLTSCTAPSEVPTWFDSIHRIPVRTVLVQGHRIAYLDAGKGPPVILVHGFGGARRDWGYHQTLLYPPLRPTALRTPGSRQRAKAGLAHTPRPADEVVCRLSQRL